MKANNRPPAGCSGKDHRPLALLVIGLVIAMLHLIQYRPGRAFHPAVVAEPVRFAWLHDQERGGGLYRLPLGSAPGGHEATIDTYPNRVRPLFFQPLSVNRADRQLLTILPGIGPVLADRIVARRERLGDFHSPHDLLAVPGIGNGKLNKIRSLLVFD